jgi:hypothetical protein
MHGANMKKFHTQVVEKIETQILCSVTFLKNRAVYEIMWKNTVQRDRTNENMAHGHFMLDN